MTFSVFSNAGNGATPQLAAHLHLDPVWVSNRDKQDFFRHVIRNRGK